MIMMKKLVSVPSLDPLSMATMLAPVCFLLLLPPVMFFELSKISFADVCIDVFFDPAGWLRGCLVTQILDGTFSFVSKPIFC